MGKLLEEDWYWLNIQQCGAIFLEAGAFGSVAQDLRKLHRQGLKQNANAYPKAKGTQRHKRMRTEANPTKSKGKGPSFRLRTSAGTSAGDIDSTSAVGPAGNYIS